LHCFPRVTPWAIIHSSLREELRAGEDARTTAGREAGATFVVVEI